MLLIADQSLLLLVDLQDRLVPAVDGGEQVLARVRILLETAGALGLPVVVSEQYPKGLGATVERLGPLPANTAIIDKLSFSCWREPRLRAFIEGSGRRQVVICGMETHVCVLQTAIDLREAGLDVFVVADGVGSRSPERRRLGLERMRDRAVDVVDSEMVVFEWLERAGTEQFRAMIKLLK
jgi:nicotinamidase-related amidase